MTATVAYEALKRDGHRREVSNQRRVVPGSQCGTCSLPACPWMATGRDQAESVRAWAPGSSVRVQYRRSRRQVGRACSCAMRAKESAERSVRREALFTRTYIGVAHVSGQAAWSRKIHTAATNAAQLGIDSHRARTPLPSPPPVLGHSLGIRGLQQGRNRLSEGGSTPVAPLNAARWEEPKSRRARRGRLLLGTTHWQSHASHRSRGAVTPRNRLASPYCLLWPASRHRVPRGVAVGDKRLWALALRSLALRLWVLVFGVGPGFDQGSIFGTIQCGACLVPRSTEVDAWPMVFVVWSM